LARIACAETPVVLGVPNTTIRKNKNQEKLDRQPYIKIYAAFGWIGLVLVIILLIVSEDFRLFGNELMLVIWIEKKNFLALGLFSCVLGWLISDIWIPTEKKYLKTINVIKLI